MDQVTQQNAAMVEETTAVTHRLASEADELSNLVSRFNTAGGSGGAGRTKPAYLKEVPGQTRGAAASASPAKSMINKVKQAFGGGAATAEDQWSEF
jgi:methyl-accepting chemotaxis protein